MKQAELVDLFRAHFSKIIFSIFIPIEFLKPQQHLLGAPTTPIEVPKDHTVFPWLFS